MKTTLLHTAIVLVAFLGITSCDDGPSGPNPGQELVVYYDAGILHGLTDVYTANIQMHGENVLPTFIKYSGDKITPNKIEIFASKSPGAFDIPTIAIYFKGSLPTAPGTYDWEPTVVTNSFSQTVSAGPVIYYNTRYYFPVSGKTVITGVIKDGSGNVTHLDGYFNGTCQSQWPGGGINPPSPLPPGFDPAHPSLIGEKLTISSCLFYTRSQ